MKKTISLKAAQRTESGSAAAKRLRRAGRVLGVLYGKKTEPISVELPAPEISKVLRSSNDEHMLINLTVEGTDKSDALVLLQDVQKNPINGELLHVDFHEVDPDEKIRVSVHLETAGEPVGVKTGGGLLEHVLREVTVECVPTNLPHNITLDVSNLNVGDAIHVSDIQPPEGVSIIGTPTAVVVTIAAPRVSVDDSAKSAESETAEAAAAS